MFLIAPSSASACVLVYDDPMKCENHRPAFARLSDQATLVAAAVSQNAAIATLRSGDSPSNAIPADDKWMSIAPGASVWLKMENGRATVMDLWLDANGQGGLNLFVYAPDISAGLNTNTKPTGRGTFNRLEPSHDLLWRGQSPNGGTWHALVTNGNSIPISFKLGFVRTAVVRDCSGPYWEYLPSGEYILWPGLCK
jgi:hypothetical protein